MGWISKVLGFLTNPIADLTGSYRERKRIAAETAANIATAEGELKVARLKAKTRRIENQENNDTDYDLIVLKNRATSLMDEFVILVFLGLFLAHFVPSLQPYMQGRELNPLVMKAILQGLEEFQEKLASECDGVCKEGPK